jgi:hypothetical protein
MNEELLDRLRRMFSEIEIERERLRSKTMLARLRKAVAGLRIRTSSLCRRLMAPATRITGWTLGSGHGINNRA